MSAPKTAFEVRQQAVGRQVLGYREVQVVAYVLRYYLDHSRAPTRSEIQYGVGIGSKGEVTRIVNRIETAISLSVAQRVRTRANLAGQNL